MTSGKETAGARRAVSAGLVVVEEARRPFFTPLELARYLSLSERTVRHMLATYEIPSYRVGGARRIDPADVDRFLSERRDERSVG